MNITQNCKTHFQHTFSTIRMISKSKTELKISLTHWIWPCSWPWVGHFNLILVSLEKIRKLDSLIDNVLIAELGLSECIMCLFMIKSLTIWYYICWRSVWKFDLCPIFVIIGLTDWFCAHLLWLSVWRIDFAVIAEDLIDSLISTHLLMISLMVWICVLLMWLSVWRFQLVSLKLCNNSSCSSLHNVYYTTFVSF